MFEVRSPCEDAPVVHIFSRAQFVIAAMKIVLSSIRARQRGGAIIIVMLMLALLSLFASANKRTNYGLNDELNRLEAEQIKRLKASGE